MDKNIKAVIAVAVGAALVVAGLAVYFSGQSVAMQEKALGVALTNDTGLYNKNLINALAGIQNDLVAVRAPLAGVAVASSSISFGTLTAGIDTAATSSVINVPGGGTIGDLCLVQTTTAASSSVVFKCAVTTTGTSTASGNINASTTVYAMIGGLASSTTQAVGTITARVWVIPVSSFLAPAALTTTD